MAWTTPRDWTASEVVTASIMNTHVRDNLNALRGGGVAITSQAALDFVYASSATQLARVAAGTAKQYPRIDAAGTGWEFGNPLADAWPIGAVFIAVVATNPATLLGFGTWEAFATGRMLVGIDAGQTEFDTVEETGGAKTHALIEAELPAHVHTVSVTSDSAPAGTARAAGSNNAQTATFDTGSVGSGTAHNNLPPYIVVYMWKRTA